ncbi:MAG: polysaccharide deacetylase family protein [Dehalococcoidia bacterium]|nr:polysaccharide deacetylase family protein [Dehalococcoidia bacterium]
MAHLQRLGADILGTLRVFDLYSSLRARVRQPGAAIFMYHSVHPAPPPWLRNVVSPSVFEQEMDSIARFGNVVPLEWLVARLADGKSIQPRTLCITFDDGYRNNLQYAWPVLRKRSLPATVFVTTGWLEADPWFSRLSHALYTTTQNSVDAPGLGRQPLASEYIRLRAIRRICVHLHQLSPGERESTTARLLSAMEGTVPASSRERLMLTWDEAIELQQNGISIGAHTVSHPVLTALPRDEARAEIALSRRAIEEHLRAECRVFAYPYGAFSSDTTRLVRDSGFSAAVTTVARFTTAASDLFALSRVTAGPNARTFQGAASGLRPDLESLGRLLSAPWRDSPTAQP